MNTRKYKDPVQKTVSFERKLLDFYKKKSFKLNISVDLLINQDLIKLNKIKV
jgi:hypothetical protein